MLCFFFSKYLFEEYQTSVARMRNVLDRDRTLKKGKKDVLQSYFWFRYAETFSRTDDIKNLIKSGPKSDVNLERIGLM